MILGKLQECILLLVHIGYAYRRAMDIQGGRSGDRKTFCPS